MLRRLRWYAAAPILAAMPVINAAKLYSASVPISLGQVVRDCVVLMVLTAAIAVVLLLSGGSDRSKGAALSLGVLLAGAYPSLAGAIDVTPCSTADFALGTAFVALLSLAFWALSRWQRPVLDSSHSVLTLLVVLTVAYIAYSGLVRWTRSDAAASLANPGGAVVALPPGPRPPDIIHIVFDGLGRLDVLQQSYGVDAPSIESALTGAGLTISHRAVANYSQTFPAVASMLSMRYLDDVERLGGEGNDRTIALAVIQQSSVIRALKARGYSFTLLSSGYEALVEHPLADDGVFGPTWFDQFESYLLPRTMLRMAPWPSLTYEPHRRRTAAVFEALQSFAQGPRPRYVLAHVLLPHPPFTFDGRGRELRPDGIFSLQDGNAFPGSADDYRRGYAGQAAYVFSRLEQLVRTWDRLPVPPIVIVHGDHGPGLGYDIRTPERSNVRDRMRIFLATRMPNPAGTVDSPVNVYRQLFRTVFGVGITPLADRSYVSSWARPYHFQEVRVQ
jgi:hypothetical protein